MYDYKASLANGLKPLYFRRKFIIPQRILNKFFTTSSFLACQLCPPRINITNFFDYNFEGFLHTSHNKWSDIFQAIIIDKLRKEIGDDGILKIHNYYKGINPTYTLPLKSSGEILYEELTGFSFNTPKNIF